MSQKAGFRFGLAVSTYFLSACHPTPAHPQSRQPDYVQISVFTDGRMAGAHAKGQELFSGKNPNVASKLPEYLRGFEEGLKCVDNEMKTSKPQTAEARAVYQERIKTSVETCINAAWLYKQSRLNL